jgi:hypothetical protein
MPLAASPRAFLFDGRSMAALEITTRFPTSLRLVKAWLVPESAGGGDCPQLRAGKGDEPNRHDDNMAAAAPEFGSAATTGMLGERRRRIALIPATVALRGSLRSP